MGINRKEGTMSWIERRKIECCFLPIHFIVFPSVPSLRYSLYVIFIVVGVVLLLLFFMDFMAIYAATTICYVLRHYRERKLTNWNLCWCEGKGYTHTHVYIVDVHCWKSSSHRAVLCCCCYCWRQPLPLFGHVNPFYHPSPLLYPTPVPLLLKCIPSTGE